MAKKLVAGTEKSKSLVADTIAAVVKTATKTRKPRQLKRAEHVAVVNGIEVCSVSWYAQVFGIDRAAVSRACSAGSMVGASKAIGGGWILPLATDKDLFTEGSTRGSHRGYRVAVWVKTDADGVPDAATLAAIGALPGVEELLDVTARARKRREDAAESESTGKPASTQTVIAESPEAAALKAQGKVISNHASGTFSEAVSPQTDIHGGTKAAKA